MKRVTLIVLAFGFLLLTAGCIISGDTTSMTGTWRGNWTLSDASGYAEMYIVEDMYGSITVNSYTFAEKSAFTGGYTPVLQGSAPNVDEQDGFWGPSGFTFYAKSASGTVYRFAFEKNNDLMTGTIDRVIHNTNLPTIRVNLYRQ